MHLLVTGAGGAIGQHVAARAKAAGHTVSGIGHGAAPAGHIVDLWVGASLDAASLDALAARAGRPDAVVHLAGGAHVGASFADPAEDFRRTVGAGQALLDWLRRNAPEARLALASSAAVYGNAHTDRIRETAPLAPISPYGTHKAMLELLAAGHARQFGQPVAVVRFFSVYGPLLTKQLIYELCLRLIRGETTITLGGTGREARDFVFIEDAAAMLLRALDLAVPAAPIVNGTTGERRTVASLAAIVADCVSGATIRFSGATRTGDPAILVGDPDAARAAGLRAPTPLAVGIARTVAWIKQQENQPCHDRSASPSRSSAVVVGPAASTISATRSASSARGSTTGSKRSSS